MNLTKLFETQKALDEHIEQQHPQEQGEDRLAKKILALQVELGECANEWRGFKFWSEDQESRTKRILARCDLCGELSIYPEEIEDVTITKTPLLEEYVDCLHFILGIGLDLRIDEIVDELDFEYASGKGIIECFVGLNLDIANLYYDRGDDCMNGYFYESIFSEFIALGEMLGFSWEQIEEAYFAKNQINHERQNDGY